MNKFRLSREKLKKDALQEAFNDKFSFGIVYSVHLKEVILKFSNNRKINTLAEELSYDRINVKFVLKFYIDFTLGC